MSKSKAEAKSYELSVEEAVLVRSVVEKSAFPAPLSRLVADLLDRLPVGDLTLEGGKVVVQREQAQLGERHGAATD